MQKKIFALLGCTLIAAVAFAIPALALAADAAPKPTLEAALGLYQAITGKLPIAAIVVAAVELLKSDILGGLLLKINQKWVPVIMLVVSGVGGAASVVLSGKSLVQGILEGFVTSGLAMTIYTTVKSINSPKAESPAPAAPSA